MLNRRELLEVEHLARKYDETNVPLYLSYPTSTWWKTGLDERVFANAYADTNAPFLYFHFPYCARACDYCACYKTTTKGEPDKTEAYIDVLTKELNDKCRLFGVDGFLNVRHLHWGGGTPTHMSSEQIERVFGNMARRVHLAGEPEDSISVEAYPDREELSVNKLTLLRHLGFNEISFGVQDFNRNIQSVIGRDTPKETVSELIGISRSLGFRVHVDLCYGLPFQGIGELTDTIESVVCMAPDRVALFAYAHYPLSFPRQRNIPTCALPNSFMRILLSITAEELFASNGYHKVGYDHFVKTDNSLYRAALRERVVRDFMGYSVAERRQFVGFGSAAISFMGGVFFQNMLYVDDYLAAVRSDRLPLHPEMGHILSADDRVRNDLIQRHILGSLKISKRKVARAHSIDFDSYFEPEMKVFRNLASEGLIVDSNADTISLTPLGQHFARHIARVFDKYE